MNQANFVQTEGYPLKAERLQELQTAYSIFNSLGNLAGNLTIISGCITAGSNVGDGIVHINGEILEFKGAAVTGTSKVIIVEKKVNRAFKSDAVKTVYTIRYATFGTAATYWNWSDFKRVDSLLTVMSRLTNLESGQNSLTNALAALTTRVQTAEDKLATIETGAKKNVQPDYNQMDNTKDNYIKNKPLADILYRGSITLGNLSATVGDTNVIFYDWFTPIDIGTSNYIVLGSLRSSDNTNLDQDPTIVWSTVSHTSTGFVANFREFMNATQSVIFDFVIVRK